MGHRVTLIDGSTWEKLYLPLGAGLCGGSWQLGVAVGQLLLSFLNSASRSSL